MKNLRQNGIWTKMLTLALLGASSYSCTKEAPTDVVMPKGTVAANSPEPESVIDLMEKEEGIVYYKKDLTLTDPTGKSTVVVRIASKDKEVFDNAIANYDYGIVVMKEQASQDKAITPNATVTDLQNTAYSESRNTKTSIIIDAISVKLEEGALRYGMSIKPNAAYLEKSKNAKLGSNTIPHIDCYELASPVWTGGVQITVYNQGNAGTSVKFNVDYKWKWWNNWNTGVTWTDLIIPSNVFIPLDKWLYDLRPGGIKWKLRARVDFNPVGKIPRSQDESFLIEWQ